MRHSGQQGRNHGRNTGESTIFNVTERADAHNWGNCGKMSRELLETKAIHKTLSMGTTVSTPHDTECYLFIKLEAIHGPDDRREG